MLKSVCDRAAGLVSGVITGPGAVELRGALKVLCLLRPPEFRPTSRWLACTALIDGGGLLCSLLKLPDLGDDD